MRIVSCFVVAALVSGCGARTSVDLTPDTAPPGPRQAEAPAASPTAALETFMGKVRKLSADATPRTQAASLEAQDPRLRAALAAAVVSRSPSSYRMVASEYWRLRVFDKAHEYLNAALAMAPQDAATFDALARLWRDAGFPQLGLADAHRAAYHAPTSAIAQNTLGTLLQAIGQRAPARDAYVRATRLDPSAAYAFNNLCYALVLDGDGRRARAACERALELQPDFAAALNNLALAFAVAGDVPAAQRTFAASGDAAAAHYNTGIVHLAQRNYTSAVDAFAAAQTARPTLAIAAARARQAAAQRAGEE